MIKEQFNTTAQSYDDVIKMAQTFMKIVKLDKEHECMATVNFYNNLDIVELLANFTLEKYNFTVSGIFFSDNNYLRFFVSDGVSHIRVSAFTTGTIHFRKARECVVYV